MTTIVQLKRNDFRRFVVAGSFPEYSCLADALSEMQFVQADPIQSPARAQDLILRHRIAGYVAGDLEKEFPELRAEEGYLFAYGFMTPNVWQSLCKRPKIRLKKLEREVLAAVSELGKVHPRELDERFGRKSVKNAWGGSSNETKRILEKLHHHGHLRVCRRDKGIRVYQLPQDCNESASSPRERYRHLVLTTTHVFGPTTKSFLISELRSHNHLLPSRAQRIAAVESLVQEEKLSEVKVGEVTYLWNKNAWTSDEVQDCVRILAPFDPLVRHRERFEHLWDWNYRFEAYVPASKRKRGYYAMPVLWRDKVIGWSNASVIENRLRVEFGYIDKRPRAKAFRQSTENEVEAMTRFLGLPNGAWELKLQ